MDLARADSYRSCGGGVLQPARHAQLGIRYLLPGLPMLILCGARGAAFGTTPRRRLVVVALLGWYAASTLSYHPHYVAYFTS